MRLLADQSFPAKAYFPDFDVTSYSTLSAELVAETDVLITRANVRLNADLLASSAVKVVASPTSGFDHFDQAWLKSAGIPWFYAPGCNAFAVAEYVLATTALLCQLIPGPYQVGIIGVGQIGSLVANYFQALGFSVLLNDPPRAAKEHDFKSVSLAELTDCDLITCHTPLTTSGEFATYHLLDHDFLQSLKLGCAVINTARGAVIDTQAAIKNSNRLTFVADVFENEPNINHEFAEQAFLATPHIAGHSRASKQRGLMMLQQQIYDFFDLTVPSNNKIIETVCCLPRQGWEQVLLQNYNPQDDRLLDPNRFNEQRNQYRQRLEHHFIFNS